MSSLANVSPGQSYPGLIKTSENTVIPPANGASGPYAVITDGEGNPTNISINQGGTRVNFVEGSPVLGSEFAGARWLGQSVVVKNKIFYGTSDSSRLDIISFADPRNPRKLSSVSVGASRWLQMEGNYVFTTSGIFDVSDPSSPTRLCSVSFGEVFIVKGGYLYGSIGGSIRIWDVRDPRKPELIYSSPADPIRTPSVMYTSFDQSGRYLFIQFYTSNPSASSLAAFDVSDPTNPRLVSEIDNQFLVPSAYQEGFVYGMLSGNLGIFDFRDPKNPKKVNQISGFTGGGNTIYIHGNTLYVTNNDVYIYAYDITDRINPVYINRIQFNTGGIRGFVVEGSYLYITARNSPFSIECVYLGGLYSNTFEAGTATIGKATFQQDVELLGNTISQTLTSEVLNVRGRSVVTGNSTNLGQVAIGKKDADSLAALEVSSSSQGIILPKLSDSQIQGVKKISSIVGGTGASGGIGYTIGYYTNVPLTGGSGSMARANMTVGRSGVATLTLTNGGKNYQEGNLLTVEPTFLSSSTSIRSLTGLTGGTGYTDGTYTGIGLTASIGFTGYGSYADVVVTGGEVSSVTLTGGGIGYDLGQTLTVNTNQLGTGGTGFAITVSSIGVTGSGLQVQVTGTETTEGILLYNTDKSSLSLYTGATSGWNSFGAQTVIKGATSGSSTYHLVSYNSEGATGISIANDLTVSMTGPLRITGMPTSSAGLAPGTLWSDPSDSYTVKMVP